MFLSFETITRAYAGLAMHLLHFGHDQEARSYKTKEVLPLAWEVENSSFLLPWCRSRRCNPFHLIFETLWVLAGASQIGVLKNYIPQAGSFSDTVLPDEWRGAYGPRLANQWQHVIDTFTADRNTRRVYIPIFEAKDLTAATWSRDIPCNFGVQLVVRNDRLDLLRYCRSNDIIWGYPVNHFEFAVLQAMIANTLQCKRGRMYNLVGSFHFYDRHAEMIAHVAFESGDCPALWVEPFNIDLHTKDLPVIRSLVSRIGFAWEIVADIEQWLDVEISWSKHIHSNTLRQCYALLLMHCLAKRGFHTGVNRVWELLLQQYGLDELTLACYLWLKNKGLLPLGVLETYVDLLPRLRIQPDGSNILYPAKVQELTNLSTSPGGQW